MKNVIREGIAMIVLVAAIILILIMVLFDYLKDQGNNPESKIYSQSAEVKNILLEKKNYENETNSITLTSAYAVDAATLSKYRATEDLRQGQSSPFDELPITEIQYDKEGNAYYKVSSDTYVKGFDYSAQSTTNSVAGTTATQNYVGSTTNETNYSFQQDINTPTENKSLVTTPKTGK